MIAVDTTDDRPVLLASLSSLIPQADLDIALTDAAQDPAGQEFPWQGGYPKARQTVLYAGSLWSVDWTEPGVDGDLGKIVRIVRNGEAARVTRAELRPATWTVEAEDEWLRGIGQQNGSVP